MFVFQTLTNFYIKFLIGQKCISRIYVEAK
jgi:hypothetical protein